MANQAGHCTTSTRKHTKEKDWTLEQRLNIRADKLAGNALTNSVENNSFINIKSSFPTEKVTISISGSRITGSPKEAIYKSWGICRPRLHFPVSGISFLGPCFSFLSRIPQDSCGFLFFLEEFFYRNLLLAGLRNPELLRNLQNTPEFLFPPKKINVI